MPARHRYYMLAASLPYLPRLDRVSRLPINRERLTQRLRMLDPEDMQQIACAASLMAWQSQPLEETDREFVRRHESTIEQIRSAALRALVEEMGDQRTILAALRRRHLGRPAPAAGEAWGVGRWVRHIEQHWAEPDFSLESACNSRAGSNSTAASAMPAT